MFRGILDRKFVRYRALFILSRVFAVLVALCLATLVHAQSADLITMPVNNANHALLSGHHPSWANDENDAGALPPDVQLESLTLVLTRPPQREQAFQQFLRDQQNSSSPNFHHWLTPVEIGQRFGVSAHDVAAIKSWLESQNLHFDSVSSSMVRIRFSGPASAVGAAFGAELHNYIINGETRISISSEAQIPAALAPVIQSVTGLYTINIRPMHGSGSGQATISNVAPASTSQHSPAPAFTGTCSGSPCFFVTPADFAAIYDLGLPYEFGFHGEGQTIAIIGRSAVNPADITNFQMRTALPQVAPTVIVPPNGVAPPPPATTMVTSPSEDQLEATLDVTRAGGVAYGSTIDLVISADTRTAGGLDVAAEYVVDTTPVPAQVMSLSFGACEAEVGPSGVHFWDNLFQQAAGEGISVFVASGDAGVAGCDTYFATPPATQTASPNYICSSSFATCVGGTEFADTANPNLYWNSGNGPGFESALRYIPEGAWNEPLNSSGQIQAAATGGGVSLIIPTPPWQTGPGVPTPGVGRYTPDIAFSSAAHDGYFACFAAAGNSCVGSTSFRFEFFSGTSAAAPDMAGITALLNQFTGKPQGNLNPILYQIAVKNSSDVFHDVTAATSGVSDCDVTVPSMCNNSIAGPSSLTGGINGFLVAPGYDEATGLGSVDVNNLLNNWNNFIVGTLPSSTTITANPNPIGAGGTTVFTAIVTTSGPASPSGPVSFFDGATLLGTVLLGPAATPPVFQAGTMFFTAPLGAGSHSITAVYHGDFNFAPSTSPVLTLLATGNNPAPDLARLETLNGVIGQAIPAFTIDGNFFIPGATINFGGVNYPGTITISGGLIITASIPASAITTPGPIPVFVVNPGPGGGPSNITNFTATSPVPAINSLSPSSAPIGQAIPSLVVTGSIFISGATVTFNGTSNPGVVSNGGATITASIPAAELSVGGNVSVTVVNPAPGGGPSNSLSFAINNPVPAVTSVNPPSASVGQSIPTFTVTGSNFVPGAVITFNGISQTSAISNNGTTITAAISGVTLSSAAIIPIGVTNPSPGGGPSNTVNFTVNNLVPTLTSISPNTSPTSETVIVTATGTAFVTGASLIFNGVSSAGTVTNNGTTLTATVAATSLAAVGTAAVTVSNPAPGGGPSNPLNFVIDDFSVSGPAQPVTITAGQTANFSLNFATQGGALPVTVTFQAANLPPLATATFVPAGLPAASASGATTLSIITTPHTSATPPARLRFPAVHPLVPIASLSLLALMLLLIQNSSTQAKRNRFQLRAAVALSFLCCAILIAGCGGSAVVGPPPPPTGPTTGTSAGTYTITVTALASSGLRTATVTLIVQ
jgi:pseudomonalisin